MAEAICNTSPVQYLFQIGQMELLHRLSEKVTVPPAVAKELAEGIKAGVHLPDIKSIDWLTVRVPVSSPVLPLVTDLGHGEREVLALALETPGAVVVLDDAVARRVASLLKIPMTGSLGILLEAKRRGFIPRVLPLVEQLHSLGFRLATHTRAALLDLAEENEIK